MQPGRLMTITDVKKFILAGKATVTLKSVATGSRFTFKITKKKSEHGDENGPHFVSLLNGPDNVNDFRYMGTIFGQKEFRHTVKSQVGPNAPSAKAFNWTFNNVIMNNETDEIPEGLEIWHEGKCCRCGRELTVPESIANGWGPECAKHF